MTDFVQDIRYGARQLRNNLGFTVAAVLCIALGIGANSAAFSFANSLVNLRSFIDRFTAWVDKYCTECG